MPVLIDVSRENRLFLLRHKKLYPYLTFGPDRHLKVLDRRHSLRFASISHNSSCRFYMFESPIDLEDFLGTFHATWEIDWADVL